MSPGLLCCVWRFPLPRIFHWKCEAVVTVLLGEMTTMPTRERALEVIATSNALGAGCFREAFLDEENRTVYKVNLYDGRANHDEWTAYRILAGRLPFGIVVPQITFLPGRRDMSGSAGDIIAMPFVEGRRISIIECDNGCRCGSGGYPCWEVRSEQARDVGLGDVYPHNFRMDSTGLIILFDINTLIA